LADHGPKVQRPVEAGQLGQRLVELELQEGGQVIARVRDVGRDVVLRSRIEVGLGARSWRRDPLVVAPQRPPRGVPAVRGDLPGEDAPPPALDGQSPGQARDEVERPSAPCPAARSAAGRPASRTAPRRRRSPHGTHRSRPSGKGTAAGDRHGRRTGARARDGSSRSRCR
jgi:hypothetical protein